VTGEKSKETLNEQKGKRGKLRHGTGFTLLPESTGGRAEMRTSKRKKKKKPVTEKTEEKKRNLDPRAVVLAFGNREEKKKVTKKLRLPSWW